LALACLHVLAFMQLLYVSEGEHMHHEFLVFWSCPKLQN
jgi:hypothetical protein